MDKIISSSIFNKPIKSLPSLATINNNAILFVGIPESGLLYSITLTELIAFINKTNTTIISIPTPVPTPTPVPVPTPNNNVIINGSNYQEVTGIGTQHLDTNIVIQPLEKNLLFGISRNIGTMNVVIHVQDPDANFSNLVIKRSVNNLDGTINLSSLNMPFSTRGNYKVFITVTISNPIVNGFVLNEDNIITTNTWNINPKTKNRGTYLITKTFAFNNFPSQLSLLIS